VEQEHTLLAVAAAEEHWSYVDAEVFRLHIYTCDHLFCRANLVAHKNVFDDHACDREIDFSVDDGTVLLQALLLLPEYDVLPPCFYDVCR